MIRKLKQWAGGLEVLYRSAQRTRIREVRVVKDERLFQAIERQQLLSQSSSKPLSPGDFDA